MRRSVLFFAAVLPLLNAGCEDGPNQPYKPASNSAAGAWNGPGGGAIGDGGTYSGNASEGYDAGFGGTNANVLCSADQAKQTWTQAFSAPILPPGLGGGIDVAGGPLGDGASGYVADTQAGKPWSYDATKETWTGCTVEQAEKIICQATADYIFYDTFNTVGWGESLEFSALYNTSSRQIQYLLFQTGYNGALSGKSVDGTTTYSIGLQNQPISVTTGTGTSQLLVDWTDATSLNADVNAVYDALRNTYQPTFPPDTDCVAAAHCAVGNNYAGGGYWYFVPLNLAIYVSTTIGSPQANSIFNLFQLGLLKLMPFSLGSTLMKLDPAGEGPVTTSLNSGNVMGATCNYKLGMTFKDFDTQCLEVFPSGDPQNTIAKNKLYGAMSHSDEAYAFNIQGIDPQFTATLADTAVVGDKQLPTDNDVAYELQVDSSVLGTMANDFTNNDQTQAQDWHGIGMITLEWANLVQQYMRTNYGVTSQLGDAQCIANPAAPGVAGKVCSGVEGIVTSAPPALVPASMKVNALGANALNVNFFIGVGLLPTSWQQTVVCSTTGAADGTGYDGCFGGQYGGPLGGYYFDTMQTAVANSFGTNPVPEALASRRFYFQEWILAFVKYLRTADNPNATLAQIDANPIDPNELFFDSAGGGFETGTYVERGASNTAMQAPTSLSITINLTTSQMNDFDFQRYNFRGEKALYTALRTTPTDQPGYEPLFLSNIVGSPVLQSVYGSYECATNEDPTDMNCCPPTGPCTLAPLDAFGKPQYAPYAEAFGQSVLSIAANGAAPSASGMGVNPTDFELIHSAMVTLPIWSNPFDPTTAMPGDQTISVLLPFVPKGANTGFPVTIDGSRDKFYNTNQVDFTGTTVNGLVDYEYVGVSGADGGLNNILVVRAVETQNYLGEVFLCAQPSNTVQGAQDILGARMYSNAADILGWLSSHPGAYTGCQMEIKYSVYGNYPDDISTLQNGVRLGLNPGFGGSVGSSTSSVVTDGTVFDPNIVASLGQ